MARQRRHAQYGLDGNRSGSDTWSGKHSKLATKRAARRLRKSSVRANGAAAHDND